MTTDLVQRLRNRIVGSANEETGEEAQWVDPLCAEAADRIERLEGAQSLCAVMSAKLVENLRLWAKDAPQGNEVLEDAADRIQLLEAIISSVRLALGPFLDKDP